MSETVGTDPGTGIIGEGVTFAGATAGAIGMINKITIEGEEADEINVSTMNTGKYKKFIQGLMDAKGATLDLLYEKSNTVAIRTALAAASDTYTISIPDGTASAKSTFVVPGFLKKLGWAIPYDDKIQQTVTLRFTGAPTFTAST